MRQETPPQKRRQLQFQPEPWDQRAEGGIGGERWRHIREAPGEEALKLPFRSGLRWAGGVRQWLERGMYQIKPPPQKRREKRRVKSPALGRVAACGGLSEEKGEKLFSIGAEMGAER